MRKRTILATLVASLLIIAVPEGIAAQEKTQSYIDINSTITREVTPDEIYLSITIRESDYKGKITLEEMQEAMIGALKTNRIDIPECLTLNYMGSNIGYTSFLKKIKLKSEATYTLRLYDVTIMQKVIAALEERQISNISLSSVKYTKEQELKRELAVEAVQQAQTDARVVAGAIGQEIGKAMTINYWMNGGAVQPRIYKSRANAMDMAVEESMPTETTFGIGKITYTLNANVRFELK